MEHKKIQGRENAEQIISGKAEHLAISIITSTAVIFQILNKKIAENQSYYCVEFINKRKVVKSFSEIQILLASFGDYAARKFLSESLAKKFTNELLNRLAVSTGTMKEEHGLSINEYMKLATERFAWHKETNKGIDLKYEGLPAGDTFKIICTELFGVYNDQLYALFTEIFTSVMLNMKMEDLLKTGSASHKNTKSTAKIATYQNEAQRGVFSQLNFKNGEKILISIARNGVKISKVGFLFLPKKTIWESDGIEEAMEIFMKDKKANPFDLLDACIDYLIDCVSIEEVNRKLNK